MKHPFGYILFFVSVVFILNMAVTLYTPAKKVVVTETSAEARHSTDQMITVCMAANSYADISVQQTNTFGSNLMRRYRPAGFSMEKMFLRFTEIAGFAQINSYKNILLTSREYFARQKLAGYYIYALCKIII